MDFLASFQKELVSLGVSLFTSLVIWLFRARPILLYGQAHSFSFLVKPPPQSNDVQPPPFTLQTDSYRFANSGRVTATQVEITFNFRPDNYQVWPVRPYEFVHSPDNRYTLRFSNLAPREEFQVELLSIRMPEILNVRCAEATGKHIPLRVARRFPGWVVIGLWSLIFLGFAACVYIVLRVGSFVLQSFILHHS